MSTKKSAARTLVLAADRSFGRAVACGRLVDTVDSCCERQVSGYYDVANLVQTVVRPFFELIGLIKNNSFEPDRFADIACNLVLFSFGSIIDLDITAIYVGLPDINRYRSLLPSVKLALNQNFSRLLTGSGVDVEVLEEDLRVAGGRSATLGLVVGLDVDCGGHRSQR